MVEVGLGNTWGSGGRWIWRILVGGALIIFVALLIFIGQRERNIITVHVPDSSSNVVQLSGGNTVEVQGASEFEYIDPDARWTFKNIARLHEGEATFMFEEKATGFVIETPSSQIVVQDAHAVFTVAHRADTTSVEVESGSVILSPSQQSRSGTRVEPNQRARTTSEHILGG